MFVVWGFLTIKLTVFYKNRYDAVFRGSVGYFITVADSRSKGDYIGCKVPLATGRDLDISFWVCL